MSSRAQPALWTNLLVSDTPGPSNVLETNLSKAKSTSVQNCTVETCFHPQMETKFSPHLWIQLPGLTEEENKVRSYMEKNGEELLQANKLAENKKHFVKSTKYTDPKTKYRRYVKTQNASTQTDSVSLSQMGVKFVQVLPSEPKKINSRVLLRSKSEASLCRPNCLHPKNILRPYVAQTSSTVNMNELPELKLTTPCKKEQQRFGFHKERETKHVTKNINYPERSDSFNSDYYRHINPTPPLISRKAGKSVNPPLRRSDIRNMAVQTGNIESRFPGSRPISRSMSTIAEMSPYVRPEMKRIPSPPPQPQPERDSVWTVREDLAKHSNYEYYRIIPAGNQQWRLEEIQFCSDGKPKPSTSGDGHHGMGGSSTIETRVRVAPNILLTKIIENPQEGGPSRF